MLGGSSALNGMVYMRGNEQNYNEWAAAGNEGWDFQSVLRYFKKSEGNKYKPFVEKDNGKYHSDIGPMIVDFFGETDDRFQTFIDAAVEYGIPSVDDLNADKHIGFARAQGTVYQGRRQSSAKAFLIPAKDRKNLHVIKNALVERILIDGSKRAYGVQFLYTGPGGPRKLTALASKEVILSAGAIMSPVVLMLSGIGPRLHLLRWGIQTIADLPVGKNLIDHVLLTFEIKLDSTKAAAAAISDETYNLAIHNSGPLANAPFIQVHVNTQNNSQYPDIQYSLNIYKQANDPSEMDNDDFNAKKGDSQQIQTYLLQPKSRGTIELGGESIFHSPNIDTGFLTDDEDMQTLVRAVRQLIALTNTEAYQKKGAEFSKTNTDACKLYESLSDDYIKCFIRYNSASGYHSVGTSKMGPASDKTTVVDPQLKVHGVKGLRQIDAGV